MMFFEIREGCSRTSKSITMATSEIKVVDTCGSWDWGKASNPDYSKPPFYPRREYRSYLTRPISYDDWTPQVRRGNPEDDLFMYAAGWSPERLAA